MCHTWNNVDIAKMVWKCHWYHVNLPRKYTQDYIILLNWMLYNYQENKFCHEVKGLVFCIFVSHCLIWYFCREWPGSQQIFNEWISTWVREGPTGFCVEEEHLKHPYSCTEVGSLLDSQFLSGDDTHAWIMSARGPVFLQVWAK